MREKGAAKKKGSGKGIPPFLLYLLILFGWMVFEGALGAVFTGFPAIVAGVAGILPYAALIVGGVFFVRSMVLVRDVQEKSLFIPALTSFLAVAAAAGITVWHPFEDWIYYAACIGCLIGVTVTCVELIRRHNLIATRPVPSFFNREGGDDKREKRTAGSGAFSQAPQPGEKGSVGSGANAAGSKGRNRADRIMGFILAALIGGSVLLGTVQNVPADERKDKNNQTGYEIHLLDEANLLSDEEEENLLWDMQPVTNYGGAAFVSGYYYNTAEKAKEMYRSYFGTDSGTLFMIDMGSRNIYIFSDGAVYDVVSKAYANTITDNVYRLATRGEYYECASEAFSQITTLLAGGHIARPMKHITNALIALILSLLINYALVRWTARIAKPTKAAILGAMTVGFAATGRRTRINRTTRRYTGSSGSGGGGGFSGGGGGGGFSGGGSSGGGGGHGF